MKRLSRKYLANLLIDQGVSFQDLTKRLVRNGQVETEEEALLRLEYIWAEETGLLDALQDFPRRW